MTILQTTRLNLRPFIAADLDFLYQLHANPEVAKTTIDGVQSLEMVKKHLDSFIFEGSFGTKKLLRGIFLEKVNGNKLDPPHFFPYECINYPTAFFHIEENSDEFDEMIIKHEMLKYDAVLKAMSLDELMEEMFRPID